MKLLPLLAAASVATAVPIHVNVKVVALGKDGEKHVETFENVDIGDTKESAFAALNALSRPHSLGPSTMNQDSAEKVGEIIDENVDAQFKELKAQGEENFKELTEQAKEFMNQAKEFLEENYLDASNRIHKVLDSQGHEVKEHREKLKAPGNFKGKKHHGSKHFETTLRAHGKKPCSSKKMMVEDQSVGGSMKQWGQDLYNDVSAIDFKESFGAIRQNEDAMCAIASGFFGGIAILTIMTVIAQFLKNNKSIKLEDDEAHFDEKK